MIQIFRNEASNTLKIISNANQTHYYEIRDAKSVRRLRCCYPPPKLNERHVLIAVAAVLIN